MMLYKCIIQAKSIDVQYLSSVPKAEYFTTSKFIRNLGIPLASRINFYLLQQKAGEAEFNDLIYDIRERYIGLGARASMQGEEKKHSL